MNRARVGAPRPFRCAGTPQVYANHFVNSYYQLLYIVYSAADVTPLRGDAAFRPSIGIRRRVTNAVSNCSTQLIYNLGAPIAGEKALNSFGNKASAQLRGGRSRMRSDVLSRASISSARIASRRRRIANSARSPTDGAREQLGERRSAGRESQSRSRLLGWKSARSRAWRRQPG